MGLSDDGMLNMAFCAGVVSVDAERRQVTVQAGARVKEVVEALRPHGLTLQNYASIAEQQIGGFVQVGAHGTGAAVPPVDEQVVRLRLHTPALGALELSEASNPRLFRLAKVGLGALGVVSEVTLQCVPAHKLLQTTFVETRASVQKRHAELLQHKHMRYMWIPHTDTVVVVTLDDAPDGMAPPPPPDEAAATKELRELLLAKDKGASAADAAAMNFAQLRDALIALDPLSKPHIIEVNRAEAAFWAKAGGQRIDWSDALLGFECGGQQWVSEVAFPCGTRAAPNGNDLAYMRAARDGRGLRPPAGADRAAVERAEPRADEPGALEGDDDIRVGIIMYLPDEARAARSPNGSGSTTACAASGCGPSSRTAPRKINFPTTTTPPPPSAAASPSASPSTPSTARGARSTRTTSSPTTSSTASSTTRARGVQSAEGEGEFRVNHFLLL